MSVLSCNREGCENIMCDRYSRDYGYICAACFQELIERGYHTDIDQFMEIPRSEIPDADPNAYEYFNAIFPDRTTQTNQQP